MRKLKYISKYLPEMDQVKSKNIEKMVGCVQVPLGVAGELMVNKRKYLVPLATTEGALVASVSRGCKVIRESGGCEAVVKEVGATRGPVFRVKGIKEGRKLVKWVEENVDKLKKEIGKESEFLKLKKIRSSMVGKNVWLRLEFDTSEAMGMNMVTFASERVVKLINKELGIRCVSLSGNYCVDKKPSWLNFIEGRGKQVWAEVRVPGKVVKEVLKTTPKKIVEVIKAKQWLGSMMSGSMGFNAHFANVVAGVFLATGQDMAHVVEGSMGVTTAEVNDKAGSCQLYFSVYLPSLMVGTVGGGIDLPTQKEALELMGLGNKKGDAIKLAEVIGGAVLAGELSLTAALASQDLAKAHRKLGRREND